MRPEHRFKPGVDGGPTAAVLVSPPLHLRIAEFLSKRIGSTSRRQCVTLTFTRVKSSAKPRPHRGIAALFFASFSYILVFLPIVVIICIAMRKLFGPKAAQAEILIASIF